jgi:hypothetical protein
VADGISAGQSAGCDQVVAILRAHGRRSLSMLLTELVFRSGYFAAPLSPAANRAFVYGYRHELCPRGIPRS